MWAGAEEALSLGCLAAVGAGPFVIHRRELTGPFFTYRHAKVFGALNSLYTGPVTILPRICTRFAAFLAGFYPELST